MRSYRTSMRYEEEDVVMCSLFQSHHIPIFCLCLWQCSLFMSVQPAPPCSHVSVTQLLSKPKFSSVEKIKTIGSTYMAAAGLTQSPIGDERKVFFCSHKIKCSYSKWFCLSRFPALTWYLAPSTESWDVLHSCALHGWVCHCSNEQTGTHQYTFL